MRSWLPLLILLVAGCLQPGPGNGPPNGADDPCNPGYYVGCDDNPDAKYMLKTYGLHQFTNSSSRVWGSNIDMGLITWVQGGFGDPVINQALVISREKYGALTAPQGYSSHPPNAYGCCIVYGITPIKNLGEPNQDGDYKNSTLWLWDIESGEHHQVIPSREGTYLTTDTGGGFDGEWILLYDRPSDPHQQQMGWAAVHAKTGLTRVLYEGGKPNDNSHYGGPLVELVIGGGHAYLSMRYESPGGNVDTAIIDVNLTTGERREILNVTHTILHMDASDNYLVLNAVINDEAGVWVWNRMEKSWTNVERRAETNAILPKVGGEWVIYIEESFENNQPAGRLVAVHMPTNEGHVLLPPQEDFGYVDIDTDGQYVVLALQDSLSSLRQTRYIGTQLYWMPLPSGN